MSDTVEPKNCPKCGAPIPPEAPQGLCPKCLMAAASLATEAGQGTAAHSAAPSIAELVKAFPQLEILELIGQGGMGFVFKARQRKLERLVALKILPQSLAADPAFAERFTREGRLLAQLSHPNIVTIHDFGQANGYFYLLMEFVDGVNLRQAMRIGRFTPAQALAIVPKICEALQYAHNEGILHRDIKPENILLDAKGRVKIADFGIAKLVDSGGRAGNPLPVESLQTEAGAHGVTRPTALTATGKILGTPQYMAPEQIERPGQVDHRADIYSLGVVFYEMLTGELPLGRFAPPSEKSTADPRLDKVVFGTLEKEPERRTQTAGEVKTQVETITDRPADSARSSQAEPTADEKRLAKRAIIAALLSGASLVFLVFGFILIVNTVFGGSQEEALISLFGILGVPAAAGTVMGILALADFRHGSIGRGFKPAVFAAAAWPLALFDILFATAFNSFWFHIYNSYQGGRLALVLLAYSVIAACMLDFILIRGVLQWSKRLPLLSVTKRGAQWFAGCAVIWTFMFLGSLFWIASTSHIVFGTFPRARVTRRSPPSPSELDSIASPVPSMTTEPVEIAQPPNATFPVVPSLNSSTFQEVRFVIDAEPVQSAAEPQPGQSRWHFHCLVPRNSVVQVLFVQWTNGVPAIQSSLSSYYKVGEKPADMEFWIWCNDLAQSHSNALMSTNSTQWNFDGGLGYTVSSLLPATGSYQTLDIPPRSFVRSRHQQAIRLIETADSSVNLVRPWSGVELRVFFEPLLAPLTRTVPSEKDFTNYIASPGLVGSMEDALAAMKQWPTDP